MNIKLSKRNVLITGMLSAVMGAFTACEKSEFTYNSTPAAAKPSVVFIGLTNSANSTTSPSTLIRYNSSNANLLTAAPLQVTGLTGTESLVAIDYRPATKVLYGISGAGRIYSIAVTATTAVATPIGLIGSSYSGAIAAFDFNPVADRLRIVTANGTNLRVDVSVTPMTVTVDGAINGAAGAVITGAAYTNSVAGATTTVLYGLDVAAQKLYTQNANAGTLTEVGGLGGLALPVTNPTYTAAYNTVITNARNAAPGGFDISAAGVGLAVFNNNAAPAIVAGSITPANTATGVVAVPSANVAAQAGVPTLFQVDLATGKLTDLGVLPIVAAPNVGVGTQIIGLAIVP